MNPAQTLCRLRPKSKDVLEKAGVARKQVKNQIIESSRIYKVKSGKVNVYRTIPG
jgi:hypothetical protein